MGLRVKYSLKLLLVLMLLTCILLGWLASRNSDRLTRYRSLQQQGVLLDTKLELGYWPPIVASWFPAAFVEPEVAWINFKDSGQYIFLGDLKCVKPEVKPIIRELVNEAQAAGFEDIRFSKITQTSGYYRRSSFDMQKLFPNVGDGRYWSMPDNLYPQLMTTNRATFGVDR